jgi:hypothetical protein
VQLRAKRHEIFWKVCGPGKFGLSFELFSAEDAARRGESVFNRCGS